ncbi:DUF7573 domain-containing protein [Paenibacillus ehimensis]|uniref:DUF7573 domain-containing protein n=1 Tax=Paenibacillus ehimensis TaxID=79264 RepID=UPI003F6F8C77
MGCAIRSKKGEAAIRTPLSPDPNQCSECEETVEIHWRIKDFAILCRTCKGWHQVRFSKRSTDSQIFQDVIS